MLAMLAYCTAEAKSFLVHSDQEFNSATLAVHPGDEIVVANGTYTPWAVTLIANGIANNPITIKAQTAGQVIFTGTVNQPVFKIQSNYIVLQGMSFSNCTLNKINGLSGQLIELDNTQHTRITGCTFEKNRGMAQFMPLVIVSGSGLYNQIDHCTFTSNIDEIDVQVKVTQQSYPTYTLINNNTFTDKAKVSWANNNGGECIQVGQDPVLLGTLASKTTVRKNHFMRCSAEPEVISNKSSENLYIANNFEDCGSELVMRGGHDCLVDSNVFKGGIGAIRVNGSGHIITHNVISNVPTGIRLMYGMTQGRTEVGFYVAATNCTISANKINHTGTGILVGDAKNEDWTGKFDTKRYPSRTLRDVPPASNTIAHNKFSQNLHNIISN